MRLFREQPHTSSTTVSETCSKRCMSWTHIAVGWLLQPCDGNSSVAPLPLYERGLSLNTSDRCAFCANNRSSHHKAARISYGQYNRSSLFWSTVLTLESRWMIRASR